MLGTVLGGGTYVLEGKTRHVLSRVDLDGRAATVTTTAFLPHGIAFHPHDPGIVVAFEKKGPGAAVVRNGGVEPILPTAGRHFYGHGSFDTDGGALISVESVIGGGAGALVIRDGATFQPIGELPSHGASPHDCWLLDGGVLAVTNGGGAIRTGSLGNVAFVEIGSGRLLDRHDITDERFNAGHLWVDPDGRLVVLSAPREGLPSPSRQQGAVSFGKRGSGVHLADPPRVTRRQMLGEALSAVVVGNRVFVSHPDGDLVTVWEDGRLVTSLAFAQPRGLAVSDDATAVFVSHVSGPQMVLSRVDPRTLARDDAPWVAQSGVSGSHLFSIPGVRPDRPPGS